MEYYICTMYKQNRKWYYTHFDATSHDLNTRVLPPPEIDKTLQVLKEHLPICGWTPQSGRNCPQHHTLEKTKYLKWEFNQQSYT